jgi:hypothetical protein
MLGWGREGICTHSGEVEEVEYVTACFPYGGAAIFLLAFVCWGLGDYVFGFEVERGRRREGRTVKPVHLSDLSAFVVSA